MNYSSVSLSHPTAFIAFHKKSLLLPPMKSFWLIFSFYILVLSVLPCTDKEECNEPIQTNISSNTKHENHNHDKEHCSPFCTCACCGTNISFTSFTAFQIIERPVFNSSMSYSLFNEYIKSNFFGNIWQPPQLIINA